MIQRNCRTPRNNSFSTCKNIICLRFDFIWIRKVTSISITKLWFRIMRIQQSHINCTTKVSEDISALIALKYRVLLNQKLLHYSREVEKYLFPHQIIKQPLEYSIMIYHPLNSSPNKLIYPNLLLFIYHPK